MSLKKRILIALAAILIIHAAFYAVPRWWATRPRVYEAAYERAVSILKDEFGEAAVEKGLFTIEMAPVSVPYSGLVISTVDVNRCDMLYVRGGETWAIWSVWTRLDGRRIRANEGRRLFALSKYLASVRSRLEGVGFATGQVVTMAAINDFTWPRRHVWSSRRLVEHEEFGDEFEDSIPAARLAAELTIASFLKRLVDDKASEEPATGEVMQAARRSIDALYPARSMLDRVNLNPLLHPFVRNAGREHLGLLKKIDRGSKMPPKWLREVPWIGRGFYNRQRQRWAYRRFQSTAGEIWSLKTIEGKSAAEAHDLVFAAAALGSYGVERRLIASKARKIAAERWPEEWYEYLAGEYSSAPEMVEEAFRPQDEDNPLVRLMAENEESRWHYEANAALYRATRDPAFAARCTETAVALLDEDPRKADTAVNEYLFSICPKGEGDADAAAFARTVLARVSLASSRVGHRLVLESAWREGEDFRRLLFEMAAMPEKVFSESFCGTGEARLLRLEAARHLVDKVTGLHPLGTYLEGCLGEVWEEEAKGSFQEILQLCFAGDTERLASVLRDELNRAQDKTGPHYAALCSTVESIQFMTSEKPFEYYRSLDVETRRRIPADFVARVLTREELQALLSEAQTREERARMLCGIVYKRDGRDVTWWTQLRNRDWEQGL